MLISLYLTEFFASGAIDLCRVVAVLALDVENEAVGTQLLFFLALDVAFKVSGCK